MMGPYKGAKESRRGYTRASIALAPRVNEDAALVEVRPRSRGLVRMGLLLTAVFFWPALLGLGFIGGLGVLGVRAMARPMSNLWWLWERLVVIQLLGGAAIMLALGAYGLLTYWLPCLYW